MAIEFQGLNQEFTTPALSQDTAIQAPSPLERSALLSRVAWRYENAERKSRYGRLGNLVAEALESRVQTLNDAASNFSWPVGNSMRNARLVTDAPSAAINNSSSTKELLRAELRTGEDAERYYKFFSRGRQPFSAPNLDGDYTFAVTQGAATENVTVSLDANQDWGEVLDTVAQALNDTSLPVQAEVIRQTAPYQDLDFLAKTGSILAVTVSAGREDQDVALTDVDGGLVRALELDATERPVAASAERTVNVAGASQARPSTFYSQAVNPVGDPGLAAGEHRLLFSVGGVADTVAVTVDEDMDWEELMQTVANRINADSTGLTASVEQTTMSSGQLDPVSQQAIRLKVTLDSPKRGQRLSLSEYGGPWLDDVDGFIDPSGGLPGWVTGGERYIASATANGWTEGNIYEYDGSAWSETTPTATNAVTDQGGTDWFYDSGWTDTASGSLLETLGLTATAWPGADATAHIDGRDMVSETGIFTLDEGRLTLEPLADTGANLPLRISEGYAEVQDRMTDLVTAYNGLQSYLAANSDLFEAGFAETWHEPVDDLSTELTWMGVTELANTSALWVDSDDFAQALVQDPERVRAAILDAPAGLAPRLLEVSAANSSPSLADHLVHPQILVDRGPSPAVEADLAKQGALAQVVAARTDAPRPEQSPYTDFTNIMADIVRQGREQMAAIKISSGASLSDTGRLFDLDS